MKYVRAEYFLLEIRLRGEKRIIMIREAKKEDLGELLKLYLFLHEDSIPEQSEHLEKTWNQIIE